MQRALISLHVFANMTDFLVSGLSADEGETEIQCGEVEEILLDNDQLALHGALWELDQEIAAAGVDTDAKLIALVTSFCEQLMEKVTLRAEGLSELAPFSEAQLPGRGRQFRNHGLHAVGPRPLHHADHGLQEAGRGGRQPHRQVPGHEACQDADGL